MNQMEANESIDTLVVQFGTPLSAVVIAALGLCASAALVEAVTARIGAAPWRWSPAPRRLRRLAFLVCGVSLAVPAVAAPALANAAAPGQPHPPRPAGAATCPPTCDGRLVGLRLPDLPTTAPHSRRERFVTVPVEPGDCLWSLAAARLPAYADDAEVAGLVATLYRLNRSRIGPDPDLVFPGTHLTAPETR